MPARTLTVAYRSGGREHALDLYLPVDASAPVVLWVHGGGWFTGDRTLAPDLGALLADRGIAAASLDYTLSGEATFPAQLHDVRAALRFVAAHAAQWGLDGTRIALWGASAGGHLAALAGLTRHLGVLPGEPDAGGPVPVRAVAAGYPPVDLARAVSDGVAAGRPAALAPESRLLGGVPGDVPDLAAAASPLTWVRPDAPPFQLAHGLADRLVSPDHSVALHEALRAAGVPSELYLLPDAGHGFLNPAGRADVAGPPLDEGRLAGGPVRATRRTEAGDEPRPAAYSYDTAVRFLAAHLEIQL